MLVRCRERFKTNRVAQRVVSGLCCPATTSENAALTQPTLWLLATFDTLLKIAKRFSYAVVIASS